MKERIAVVAYILLTAVFVVMMFMSNAPPMDSVQQQIKEERMIQ